MGEMMKDRLIRLIAEEQTFWRQGILPGGVDEAGRGPLAGPVVAACVIMQPDKLIEGVYDSKKVTLKRRETLYGKIMEAAERCAVEVADVDEIERLNIRGATRAAMERAALRACPDFLLTDYESNLDVPCPQRAYVGGDALIYGIAAASILAKVFRDRMMLDYHDMYPQYGFARNKGYGTRGHIAALREYGPCPIHRKLFVRKFVKGEGV